MLRRLFALPLIAVLWSVFGPAQVVRRAGPRRPQRTVRRRSRGRGRRRPVDGRDRRRPRPRVSTPPPPTSTAASAASSAAPRAWQARQLAARAAALRPPPAGRVAVVAWLGYHPPRGIRLAAVREDAAATGAAALLRFLRDVPAPRLVLVGHSYGSTVIGRAAARLDAGLGGRVTDVVALGSPGMGARPRRRPAHPRPRLGRYRRRRLDPPPARRAPPRRRPRHPPTDPAFGALPLPVDGVTGHDGYFVPGTASLDALAAIAIGDLDAAARHAH